MDLTTVNKLPSLDTAEVSPVELGYEYWTPTQEGETRRMHYVGRGQKQCPDHSNPEESKLLTCAIFVMQDGGSLRTVVNASARLVGKFEDMPDDCRADPIAVSVEYAGKRKNKTNSHSGDEWIVRKLIVKGAK